MVSTLKLPVGIENFEEIRRNRFYYVDKTKLIEQLVETGGKVTLFTRPRRFGKTLNMSMLRSFFEMGSDASLFDGLYIAENKALCEEYMGKYPVIFLSLKSVEGLNFEDARYRMIELISIEAERFGFLADSEHLSENEREYSITVKLPALGVAVFTCTPEETEKKPAAGHSQIKKSITKTRTVRKAAGKTKAAVKTAVKPVTKKVTKEAPQIVNKTEPKISVKKDLTEKK